MWRYRKILNMVATISNFYLRKTTWQKVGEVVNDLEVGEQL